MEEDKVEGYIRELKPVTTVWAYNKLVRVWHYLLERGGDDVAAAEARQIVSHLTSTMPDGLSSEEHELVYLEARETYLLFRPRL